MTAKKNTLEALTNFWPSHEKNWKSNRGENAKGKITEEVTGSRPELK